MCPPTVCAEAGARKSTVQLTWGKMQSPDVGRLLEIDRMEDSMRKLRQELGSQMSSPGGSSSGAVLAKDDRSKLLDAASLAVSGGSQISSSSPEKVSECQRWQRQAEECKATLDMRTRLWEAKQKELSEKVRLKEKEVAAKRRAASAVMKHAEACSAETTNAAAAAGRYRARIESLKRALAEAEARNLALDLTQSHAQPLPGRRLGRTSTGTCSARDVERPLDTDGEYLEVPQRWSYSLSPRGRAGNDGEVIAADAECRGLSRSASLGGSLCVSTWASATAVSSPRGSSDTLVSALRRRVMQAEAKMRELQEAIRNIAHREKLLYMELTTVRDQVRNTQASLCADNGRTIVEDDHGYRTDEDLAAAKAAVEAAEAAVAVAHRLQTSPAPLAVPTSASRSRTRRMPLTKNLLSKSSPSTEVRLQRKLAEEEAAALRAELRCLQSRRAALPGRGGSLTLPSSPAWQGRSGSLTLPASPSSSTHGMMPSTSRRNKTFG